MHLYYLLSYTTGIVILTLYTAYFIKTRNNIFLNILIFNANLLFLVILLAYYHFYPFNYIVVVNDILCLLMSYTLMRFALSTVEHKYKKVMEGIYIVIPTLLFFYNFLYSRIIAAILIFLSISIVLSMIIIVDPLRKINGRKMGRSGRMIGIFSLIFLPFILLIDFFSDVFPNFLGVAKDFNSIPIFYMFLNLGLFIALKNRFWIRIRDFALIKKRFDLTEREIEVLILLISAKSYRDIGEELSISLSTVKTHISRIYQKTETNNKVELIALIDS